MNFLSMFLTEASTTVSSVIENASTTLANGSTTTGTEDALTTTTTEVAKLFGIIPANLPIMEIGLIVVMIIAMYFLMIRPQRKRQKEEQQMRNSLRVGDEITTIGGICGRVLQIKEDSLVIETGADRSKMTIKKWAIQTNDTPHDPKENLDDDDDDI